jgi:peptidylprolyl isomerase
MKAALVLLALSTAAAAQTTAAKPATHHSTASSTAAAATVVNPPGAPKVVGVPKTLYALKYIDIKIGTGPVAVPHKWYTVHYTGWLPDGKKFDSSVDRKEPFTFPYGAHRVIIGWDTGFEGMRVGGKRRLIVPWELAYGELGMPGRGNPPEGGMPPKQNLIFDVELLGISDTPPESMLPKPPAAPPAGSAAPAPKPESSAPTGQAPATPPAPPSATEPAKPAAPATPPPPAAK